MEVELLYALSALAWFLALFGATLIGFWLFEVVFLREGAVSEAEHGAEKIQVRFVTVAAERVVQESVNALPDVFDDVHVVAEEDIEVEGAEVHVVSKSFDCEAEKKGRALEWSRKNIDSDREYVLYLDEDSHLANFPGLPDRDVIQLREEPQPTGSMLSYIADVFRMGLQVEQLSFANLKMPLFVWGGGLAVKSEVENHVTWNRLSLVEDTAFAWAAALKSSASFGVAHVFVQNQAPPSVPALLRQRRRWAGGNHIESSELPSDYRFLTRMRNYSWGLTPVSAILMPLLFYFTPELIGNKYLGMIGWGLSTVIPSWYILGIVYYPRKDWRMLLGIVLLPFSALLHGFGALWGILSPPKTFQVTPKK